MACRKFRDEARRFKRWRDEKMGFDPVVTNNLASVAAVDVVMRMRTERFGGKGRGVGVAGRMRDDGAQRDE